MIVRVIVPIDDSGVPTLTSAVRRDPDAELCGRHTGAKNALGSDRSAIDGQASERTAQRVERQAEIQQRSQHHVAGDA